MRYVKARIKQYDVAKAYRIYVTDGIKILTENTSRYAGGSSFKRRFAEVYDTRPVETRTSEEIIESIKGKLIRMGD